MQKMTLSFMMSIACISNLIVACNESKNAPQNEYSQASQAISEPELFSNGGYHTCTIVPETKHVQCWGRNDFGQLGLGMTEKESKMVPIVTPKISPQDVFLGNEPFLGVSVVAGDMTTCAIDMDKQLYCWGWNYYGGLGLGASDKDPHPTPLKVSEGIEFQSIGVNNYCALSVDNDLYCWGGGSDGSAYEPKKMTLAGGDSIKFQSIAKNRECAISMNNDLYCWGNNSYGQLGIASYEHKDFPEKVVFGAGVKVKSVAGDYASTCAISMDDRLYCWGNNSNGQLGIASNEEKNSPEEVKLGSASFQVKSVHLKNNLTCAISMDDRLYCWGDNWSGKLGIGITYDQNIENTEYKSTPQEVKLGDAAFQVKSVHLGSATNCAISKDNKLYCWGNNRHGQLGIGITYDQNIENTEYKSTPQLVKLGDSALQVKSFFASVNWGDMWALSTEGKLYHWGMPVIGMDGQQLNIPTEVKD